MIKYYDLSELYPVLEHDFNDPALLKRALTLGYGDHFNGYERLEFLGDRVLGLSVARMLYENYGNEAEGGLARRFADLTRAETLAEIAERLGLRKYVFCESQNDLTLSVMSDVCEAVLAALYLDAGFDTARAFVQKHWAKHMLEFKKPPVDAKTKLQEWAQAKKKPLPVYTEIERTGPDHSPVFVMKVSVVGCKDAQGRGASKREASQKAAEALLKAVGAL